MFTEDESVLNGLTYPYERKNCNPIDIRIHNDDFCILEDMLANLLEIDIMQLHSIILQLIEEEKIVINQHIIYHAWYGNSGGKLYKLRTNKIDQYSENLQEPCLEDDKLKIVISSEAIKEVFKKIEFNQAERFLKNAEEALEESRMFKCFVQGIICGVDDSISKINFGDQLQIYPMKMPDDNDFLRNYWCILDVFSFSYRFCNATIQGQGHVNTLISRRESGFLSDLVDEQGRSNLSETHIEIIKSKVNKIINTFKVIRLVSKKPIWCSELIRTIYSGAMGNSNPLRLPDPYKYSKEHIHTLSDEDAVRINQLIDVFPVMLDDKIIELALKNYDYSFFVPDDVAIILLVTCLEILFHPGDKDELKNRVARNAAVFLGNNTISSGSIFDDIKSYYDIRSSLVHSGIYKDKKTKKTQKESVNDLRSIVSRAIIEYNITVSRKGIKRDDYFDLLTSSGFNSKPFCVE